MAVVIPFQLSAQFTDGKNQVTITRVVSLHNPVPAFQAYFDQDTGNPIVKDDANLTRRDSFISVGFPSVHDASYPSNSDTVPLIPQNAYAVTSASKVYGTSYMNVVVGTTMQVFSVPALNQNVGVTTNQPLNLPKGTAITITNQPNNQTVTGRVYSCVGTTLTVTVVGGNCTEGTVLGIGSEIAIPNANSGNAILLLDVTVAPVEPGFSRLRVDYQDINHNSHTEYFTMPFWEGWDIHPREVQEIVDYMEGAFEFMDAQVSRLWKGLTSVELHEQLRGLTVSGGLNTTKATDALGVNSPIMQAPPGQKMMLQSPIEAKDVPVEPVPDPTLNNITAVSPQIAHPGDAITVTVDFTPDATDQLVLLNTILPTTVDAGAKTLSATLPLNLPFTTSLPLFVVSNLLPKTGNFIITMQALPKAYSIQTTQGVAFGAVGDLFTITGRNFGISQGTGTVSFTPGVNASITAWGDGSITGTIPTGAQSGPITVTTNRGQTATLNFMLRDPRTQSTFQVQPGVEVITVGSTLQFSALYDGAEVTPNWSVVTPLRNIGAGNVTYGTIMSNGLYSAPSSAATAFTVKVAASYKGQFGHMYAEASIVVLPAANEATIAPSSVSVAPNYTQRFTLSNNGVAFKNVDWYVNGVLRGTSEYGTITDSGLYQAPALRPVTGTVYVTGIDQSGLTATSAVQIQEVGASMPAMKFIQSDEKTTYNYTCNPGDTITIGNDSDTRIYPPDGCGGCVEYSFQWTAPMTPAVYTVNAQGSCLTGSTSTGPIPIQQPKILSGTTCKTSPLGTKYTVNVVNPQPAAPQLGSIGSACPGQKVTVTGKYFPSDVQCYLAGTNEIFPMVTGSLSTTDHITYTFNVTIPSDIASNATGLQVYVKGSTGQSNNVPFTIPSSCATPPTPANFIVSGPPSVCSSTNAKFSAYFNGTDVTTQCVWSSNASGGIRANDGVFYAPATTGTYSVTATYNGNTNSASIIVRDCTPPPPAPSTCDYLTVQPANVVLYIGNNSKQSFTAYMQLSGGPITPTIPDQWYVNGIPGGNSQVGWIDANGVYTPPLQSPGYVHIQISATKTVTKTS